MHIERDICKKSNLYGVKTPIKKKLRVEERGFYYVI